MKPQLTKFLFIHGIRCPRNTEARNFAPVLLARTMLYAYNIETKVIRNFIRNFFGDYTFFLRRCDFRVIWVNVKFGSTCQSQWTSFCMSARFIVLGCFLCEKRRSRGRGVQEVDGNILTCRQFQGMFRMSVRNFRRLEYW